ncbi:hypothetical protein PABG_11764 [Paracoccidioides brasiliensis Pb03]|nr:hypothetical protein PABG_11764 [Paracoccidioides brasiliensis Pb03]
MDTLLTTVEYKPPHKLSVENFRVGLRPMNFWETVVKPRTIPVDKEEKLKHNAQQISGSAVVQHYHTMIEDGIPYAYVTNGLAFILLHVPYDDPSTLYYFLCEPNLDLGIDDNGEWRNAARAQLHIWKTSFDYTLSEIPEEELRLAPPDSEYSSSEYTGSEYLPSSPAQTPAAAQFCTQRCLRGLRSGDLLDHNCPNVAQHQHGENVERHCINDAALLRLLSQQLDDNLDRNCSPLGIQGTYGAIFKLTCAEHGYTGVAVPIFLGSIDLAEIYFLHGFGPIRHMLLMAWGGESIANLERWPLLQQEISRSTKGIRALGVIHGDLQPDNILWNNELKRAIVIDFHRCRVRSSVDGKVGEEKA